MGLHKKRQLSFQNLGDLADRLRQGDRIALSRAITLVESQKEESKRKGQALVSQLLSYTGSSLRLGITGVPGAGKSTFIDDLGSLLINKGYRVSVLAVDPSSQNSGGSILGDKTRMGKLAHSKHAFVRPSPAGRHLGGVAMKTREAILLCEAAGYDAILVETVGVGQSEVHIQTMVDFLLLLVLTGAGDELQGMKRGIMEIVDSLVVAKADGSNRSLAERTRHNFRQFFELLPKRYDFWDPEVYLYSHKEPEMLEQIWQGVQGFVQRAQKKGAFARRREEQRLFWFYESIRVLLEERFYGDPDIQKQLEQMKKMVLEGQVSALNAAETLLDSFRLSDKKGIEA